MESPLISIVLTLYNKAPYIEETLFSIYKQTYTNRELIIVDDCSTDGSFEIAKSFCEKLWITEKCKFIQNEKNLRVAKTFEKGLKEAKGEWISMCDGDDILMKDKLEKQLELCEEKKVDFCFCEYLYINQYNHLIWLHNNSFFWKLFFKAPNYKMYLLWSNAIWSGIFFNNKIRVWLLTYWFPVDVYQDHWAILWNYLLQGKTYRMDQYNWFFYRRCEACITYGDDILQLYKKNIQIRLNAQKYILSFERNENIINRIKKKNIVDILFSKRLDNKETFIHVLRGIFISWLEFKYKGILLYQALNIQFLKLKKWFNSAKTN